MRTALYLILAAITGTLLAVAYSNLFPAFPKAALHEALEGRGDSVASCELVSEEWVCLVTPAIYRTTCTTEACTPLAPAKLSE